MPPKGSKRKSREEETPAKANTPPTVGENSRDALSLEPKRRKQNADAEDGGGDGEVSARNIFLVRIKTAHIDNSFTGRRAQSQ